MMKRSWTSGAVEAPDRRILRRRIPRKKSAVMKKWKMRNQMMRMKKIRWTSLAIVDPLRQRREQTALTELQIIPAWRYLSVARLCKPDRIQLGDLLRERDAGVLD